MNLTKHSDFFNPVDNDVTIHIIGLGSLGSNLAHLLVRLGFENLVLYDFDDITDNNLTNQFYFHNQVGSDKLPCLMDNLRMINPNVNLIGLQKYKNQHLYDIVFLCLDSIKERRRIMELNMNNINIKLMNDIRLGLGEGQAFSADRSHFNSMLSTMQFEDDESTTPINACGTTMRILPTIYMITSLAVNNLINFLKNDEYHRLISIDSLEGIATKLLETKI